MQNMSKSKTDQNRTGNEVLISKGYASACPYSRFLRYMSLASLNTESGGFLYRPLFRSGAICKLIYRNKKLSYIIELFALCKGGNFNIHIWAWFGYLIC